MWTAAFASDPVIRWFLPDEASYPSKGRALFGFMFDVRHLGGELWVRDNLAAAAWNPPDGLRPIDPPVAERWASLAGYLHGNELERIESYGDALDPLLPERPHWYLGILGTAPGQQGNGHGKAVMAPILERANSERVPQSLETCVASNRDVYQRWGFEVTGEFRVAEGPQVWVMVREPSNSV